MRAILAKRKANRARALHTGGQSSRSIAQTHSIPVSPGTLGSTRCSRRRRYPRRRGTPALASLALSWCISTRLRPRSPKATSVRRPAYGLGCEPATDKLRVKPIADLKCARTDSAVKSTAAGDRFVDEHRINQIFPVYPSPLPAGQQLAPLLQRPRLLCYPRNPRSEVLDTFEDCFPEALGVAYTPAPQQETIGLDSFRGLTHVLALSAKRDPRGGVRARGRPAPRV